MHLFVHRGKERERDFDKYKESISTQQSSIRIAPPPTVIPTEASGRDILDTLTVEFTKVQLVSDDVWYMTCIVPPPIIPLDMFVTLETFTDILSPGT